ncbi:MAG: hypothetical protein WC596_04390 [Candidatus Shapirobacteria bacterium]
MAGKVEFAQGVAIRPTEIEGWDFSVPPIRWTGDHYGFENLRLPNDWQKASPRLTAKPQDWGNYLENLCQERKFDWNLQIDGETGLVTEIKLRNLRQESRVYLDTGFGHSGVYRGERFDSTQMVNDLHMAVIYQKFLARYLSFISGDKPLYPYIDKCSNQYCSRDLALPPKVVRFPTSYDYGRYQQGFDRKACQISGQFGLRQLPRVCFDENGLLTNIQIDNSKACDYNLDHSSREYYPHNVDNACEAAALHGIAATFINDLIEARKTS